MANRNELAALPFFEGIEPGKLEPLAAAARVLSHAAGAAIFKFGDVARELHFVLEGRVAIQIPIPGRGPTTVLTVGEGEVFGWSAFVPPHEETATARAVMPVTAMTLGGQALREACRADLELGLLVSMRLNEVLASRLWAMKLQLTDLYAAPAEKEPART